MKIKTIGTVGLSLLAAGSLQAITSFSEDFEGNLSKWISGDNGDVGSGPGGAQIVSDPVIGSNKVLNFKRSIGGGDIFSADTVTSGSGSFTLEFDYYGTSNGGNGFVGHSQGTPGTHFWLFGSSYPGIAVELANDGTWGHYSHTFAGSGPIRLMVEDFRAPEADAFFDNFSLRDASLPNPLTVPDTGLTALLLGAGLFGLAAVRRKLS